MNMKIFNFGLPKTGTFSFHRFLFNNGIRSIHTNDGFIEHIYPDDYYKFKNNERSILDYIIDKNDAFGDLPWYSLSEEIIKKYREKSLFFVTTREARLWAKSIVKIHCHMFTSQEISSYHSEVFCGLITKNSIASDKKLINFFNEYNEKIIEFSKKHNVEVQFLKLDDIEGIKKILKSKINIINETYPSGRGIAFL